MSIVIHGLDMPKSIENDSIEGGVKTSCTISIWSDGKVFIYSDMSGKESVAKAEQLPPHGRLGDLDVLQKEFEEDANFYDEMHGELSEFDRQRTEIQYTIERIKNAPTIIEAEG